MSVQSLILLTIVLFNGSLVWLLQKSQRNIQNILFALAISSNVLWTLGTAMFISSHTLYSANLWLGFFLIAPLFTAYFLLVFTFFFPTNSKLSTRNKTISIVLTVPLLVLSVLILLNQNLLIANTVLSTNASSLTYFEVNKFWYTIYTAYFSVYFFWSYVVLFNKSRIKGSRHKIQVRYVLLAAVISSFLAMITNLNLPLLGNGNYIFLGPIFTVGYLIVVGVAIAKHHLFDIRAAVARGGAYALSLLAIIGVYTLFITVLSNAFGLNESAGSGTRFIFTVVAVVSAIIFSPLKRFFDKLTIKVFYRNSYEPGAVIDQFSSKVVKNYQIDELIASSIEVLQKTIQPESSAFIIRHKDHGYIIRATTEKIPSQEELFDFSSELQKIPDPIIEVNLMPPEYGRLRSSLKRYGASVLVRLMVGEELVGYLVLGEKKNGDAYVDRDKLVLGVISEELALAIQNALRYQEIEGFNEKLIKEIDQATRALKQSNAKLQALDEAKDEFISMASHQLRTPLTSIKGYLSMVLDGDVGKVSKQQSEMLSTAYASAQRMVYLIADLLNVSRLQTGKFVIEKNECFLPEMVEEEIAQLKEAASAKNISFEFKKPADFPKMMLDETKIRQVIMNFADNALYYTPAGGKVKIELRANSKSVELTITDNGIGVPKDEQHKLFSKFYRAGNAQKARPDGTGLGLFMAKKVVVASGGAIIFRSREGKGSTFGFTFPRLH